MADNSSAKRYRTPFYPMLHPIDGYREMRYNGWGNAVIAAICVLLLFFAVFAKRQLFGFAFRVNVNPDDLNLPLMFILSVGLCVLFTVINWAICTLFDGGGRISDIWVVTGYSLAPYILCVFIACVLSQALTSEETVFIEAIQVIGAAYSVFLLIKGLEAYHEYSFKGAMASLLCTGIGIVLLMLLGVLLFSIVQQFVAFAVTIYQELLLRTR